MGNRKLNGIWIDFIITAMLYFYLNLYNLWLIQEPHKIYTSEKTNELIRQHDSLVRNQTIIADDKALRKELQNEILSCRLTMSLSSAIYTNFGLMMIMFILFISIFSKSVLSFGYFIFCMLLIYNTKSFFKDTDS